MSDFVKRLIGWAFWIMAAGAFLAGYGFIVSVLIVVAILWTMRGAGKKKPPEGER